MKNPSNPPPKMLPKEAKLINKYFEVLKELLDASIIRSDSLLGHIGEWICNSPEGKNQEVGKPNKYDELIVLLGPRSRLRVREETATFHVYRFPSSDVERYMKQKKGYSLARTVLKRVEPEFVNIEA
jgi:hypothetical protein